MTARPEVRETHSAFVLFLGDTVYKIKKPVVLDFLDFGTAAARERACAREVELNRRLCPDVYRGVGRFVPPDGGAAEPVVVMRRLPADRCLEALVRSGADVRDDLRRLARLLAGFHASACRDGEIAAVAGPDGLRRRWTDNLREAQAFAGTVFDADELERIERLAGAYLDGRRAWLHHRAAAGAAVDGHGDLTAADVYCLDDGPRVIDCLDFDDALRFVDVLDDVAFLAMDLEHLGRPELGTWLLERYQEFSAAPAAPASLRHHFLAYRAFVRAKVLAVRHAQGEWGCAQPARGFAVAALHHLEAAEVRLVLVGGGPGTGKSTVAAALADRLDAVLLSTDGVRRELTADARPDYGCEGRAAVYRELLRRARVALEGGATVVADATWPSDTLRAAAAWVADETAARLVSLECRAPVDVAAARAEARLAAGGSVSDAGATVVRALAAGRAPWPSAHAIDTSGAPSEAVRRAAAVVGPGAGRLTDGR